MANTDYDSNGWTAISEIPGLNLVESEPSSAAIKGRNQKSAFLESMGTGKLFRFPLSLSHQAPGATGSGKTGSNPLAGRCSKNSPLKRDINRSNWPSGGGRRAGRHLILILNINMVTTCISTHGSGNVLAVPPGQS